MSSSLLYFCPYIYCSCYKGRLRPFPNFKNFILKIFNFKKKKLMFMVHGSAIRAVFNTTSLQITSSQKKVRAHIPAFITILGNILWRVEILH